jgi:hypothetical protein
MLSSAQGSDVRNDKQALDSSNLKLEGEGEGIKRECGAAIHLVLAQYCSNVGLVRPALQHLTRAEAR